MSVSAPPTRPAGPPAAPIDDQGPYAPPAGPKRHPDLEVPPAPVSGGATADRPSSATWGLLHILLAVLALHKRSRAQWQMNNTLQLHLRAWLGAMGAGLPQGAPAPMARSTSHAALLRALNRT